MMTTVSFATVNAPIYKQSLKVIFLDGMPNCRAKVNDTIDEAMCSHQSWPVPLLLAAYMFFGNILMVNMLIAIFT